MHLGFQADFPAGLVVVALGVVAAALLATAIARWWSVSRRFVAPSGWVALAGGLAGAALAAAALAEPAWQRPALLLPALLGLAGLAIVLFYQQLYGYLGRWRMLGLIGLRLAGVVVVLLLLGRPILSLAGVPADAPLLLAVVDTSASMGVSDRPNTPPRLAQAAAALDLALPAVSDVFRTQLYMADSVVQAARDTAEITRRGAIGEASNLNLALADPVQRHPADDLAGVLLLSDGQHNSGPDPLAAAGRVLAPLYTVAIGQVDTQAAGKKDLAVVSVDAPFEAPANNLATLQVSVQAQQFTGQKVRVRLLDGQTELAGADLLFDKPGETRTATLTFTPTTVGRKRYVAEAVPDPAEALTENNRYPVPMLVTDPKIKVLYIEPTIRQEYGPLRITLSKDKNISLTDFYQPQPGKFQARSDQSAPGSPPVLPTTLEQFQAYDVIILGDVPRALLSGQQQAAIRDAVRGGKALLMIGGSNTLGPGGYAGSPVEDALPVKVGPVTLPDGGKRQDATPFLPLSTAEGRLHPILSAGLADAFAAPSTASQPLGGLADLKGCVVVDAPKPGAAVLLVNPKRQRDGQPLTVLAVQQYGQGRAAVFTADTTAQWYRSPTTRSTYQKFWGQLVRWLANREVKQKDLGAGVQIVDNKGYYEPGVAVRLAARVRGPDGLPTASAAVRVDLVGPDGVVQPITLAPDAAEAGLFTGAFTPTGSGVYQFKAVAQSLTTPGGPAAAGLGEDRDSFVVSAPGKEFDKLALNAPLLEQLARASVPSGYLLEPAGLPALLEQLRRTHLARLAAQDVGREIKVMDFPWWALGLFVGLLSVEWLLRRRWQLT